MPCRLLTSLRNQAKRAPSGSGRTRWTVVRAAGGRSSPEARDALAALCQIYWYPLYAYVRRRGHSPSDAQDLTQAFFARLLEKNIAGKADRAGASSARFCSRRLSTSWPANGVPPVPASAAAGELFCRSTCKAGESRYVLEPVHELTAEKIFQRRWALTLLEQTLAKLRDEFAASGKLDLFEHLKAYLGGDESKVPYRDMAAELGKSEGAIKVAVHRLRQRCRELLRAEIAETVVDPQEVDDELRDLFDAVSL